MVGCATCVRLAAEDGRAGVGLFPGQDGVVKIRRELSGKTSGREFEGFRGEIEREGREVCVEV